MRTGLGAKERREILQLRFAAKYYLQLADKLRGQIQQDAGCNALLGEKIASLSAKFETHLAANSEELDIHRLVAHLASAAVRLVTIEERLAKVEAPHEIPTSFAAYRRFKKEKGKQASFEQEFLEHRSEWLHILLRDNVAHIERDSTEDQGERNARQNVIEQMTPNEIFGEIEGICRRVKETLNKVGIANSAVTVTSDCGGCQ